MSKYNRLARFRNVLAGILITVGIGLMLLPKAQSVMLQQQTQKSTKELNNLTRDLVVQNEEKPVTFEFEDVSSVSLSSILEANKSKAKAPMIGEIAIPELAINLPILHGISDHNLLVGAATMTDGQVMGKGNYSLASHYSDAADETLLFSPLRKAEKGMAIYLTDLDRVYTYQITEIFVVDPSAVHVLDETGEDVITLVTCEDLAATHRRIVRGKLINTQTVEESSHLVNVFESDIRTY